jgi:hypothetical protein
MAKRKLKEHDEYCYGPRRALKPGDRFRVKGGPIYVTDDGNQVPMYERGAEKWLEARRADTGGVSVLWVGRAMRSPAVPSLRRRPYRITRKIRQGSRAGRSSCRSELKREPARTRLGACRWQVRV